MTDDIYDITEEVGEWFDTLSEERKALLRIRYERDTEDIYDSDEQMEIFERILKEMYIGDILKGLQDKGLIEPSRVREDGEVQYGLTPITRKIIDDHERAQEPS